MALITTDIDPFGDGSLVSSKLLDGDITDLLSVGTISGGVAGYEVSKFNDGAIFNGAQYIASSAIPMGVSSFTYSFWISNLTNTVGVNNYFIDWATGRGILATGGASSNNLEFFNGVAFIDTGYQVPDGQPPIHIVLVARGTGFSLYADDVEVYVNTTDAMPTISGSCTIGARYTNDNVELFGTLDQFMIFNRALTRAEVTELNTMVLPSASTGLAISFNGIETTQVFFNGTEVTEANFNGILLA